MRALLKHEGYRILHDRMFWIVFAVLMVIFIWMGSMPYKSAYTYNGWSLTEIEVNLKCPEMHSYGEFYHWYAAHYAKFVFPKAMSDSGSMTYIGFIFAAYFFGIGFTQKNFNGAIYAGYSRTNVLLSKMIWYFIFVLFMSFVPILLYLQFFSSRWATVFSASYIVRCFLLRALLDLATMCVPMLIAFLCRGIFKTVAVSFGVFFAYMLLQTPFKGTAMHTYVFGWFPSLIYERKGLWDAAAPAGTVIGAFVTAGCVVVVLSLLSWYTFRKTQLR